ncbi:Trp biosynthesis-associated membrane protein [Microbacterium sp.]|uniref:Trp biosynthesis-associated membrane protein n=1 Tax=Microbacterium sp. TaxID=51671 RepID=UPI003A890DF7
MTAVPARARTIAVLAIVAGGGGALIASTQPWLDVVVTDAHASLWVTGSDAMALLAPLSLAALALGLALALVGRVFRYVFAVLALILGLGLIVGTAAVAVGIPVDAYAAAVTETTGLSGADTVRDAVTGITVTGWPVLAVFGGCAVVAGGAWTLTTAHLWPVGGRRYAPDAESPVGSRSHDAVDDWDDLSRGEDPTA